MSDIKKKINAKEVARLEKEGGEREAAGGVEAHRNLMRLRNADQRKARKESRKAAR